jgi:hypothetical protein
MSDRQRKDKTKKPNQGFGKRTSASSSRSRSRLRQSANKNNNRNPKIANGLSFIESSQGPETPANIPYPSEWNSSRDSDSFQSAPLSQGCSRLSESPQYDYHPLSSSRELLLNPGIIKPAENYPQRSLDDSAEEGEQEQRPYKFVNNSDLPGPSWAKKAMSVIEQPTRTVLRDSILSVTTHLSGLNLFNPGEELSIKWTIPFDTTNKDEVLKISGTKGTYTCTVEPCTTTKGWEEISSCIHANLPMGRSKTEFTSFPILVKFRLKEPFRLKRCQDDALKSWLILLSSGLRFTWENEGVIAV